MERFYIYIISTNIYSLFKKNLTAYNENFHQESSYNSKIDNYTCIIISYGHKRGEKVTDRLTTNAFLFLSNPLLFK